MFGEEFDAKVDRLLSSISSIMGERGICRLCGMKHSIGSFNDGHHVDCPYPAIGRDVAAVLDDVRAVEASLRGE